MLLGTQRCISPIAAVEGLRPQPTAGKKLRAVEPPRSDVALPPLMVSSVLVAESSPMIEVVSHRTLHLVSHLPFFKLPGELIQRAFRLRLQFSCYLNTATMNWQHVWAAC